MSNDSKGDTTSFKGDFYCPADPQRPDPELESLFDYIDAKHGFLINRLRDFVEFRTVSSDPSKKDELLRMSEYVVEKLKKFGFKSTVKDMIEKEEGSTKKDPIIPLILECIRAPNDASEAPVPPEYPEAQSSIDSVEHLHESLEIPNVWLTEAETDIDPAKRTVLFYCHYDVYPVNYHECWDDPFELRMTIDESEIHGKGASEGKGPLLCVINAIGAYQKKKIPLPVNVKLILDPLGTLDEDTTSKFLRRIDTDFFLNVDFVCLCAGRWLGTVRPCITHGSRGICYFTVEVEGPSKDLHSGCYGGLFNEPMADLMYILNGLVDRTGIIRITDIYEDVPPITKEERNYFKTIHFSVRDFQQDIGASELQVNEDKASILMRLWRQPSLSIHGVQGAFSEPGVRNIIPGKVIGKFSITLVPNMSPSKVKKKVVDYLGKVWKARKSSNKIRLQMTIGKLFWYTEPSDINVIAAKNAVAKVYSTEPDLIREPSRVRIANVLRKMTEAPVVMIPIGKSSDISDEDSEKVDVVNYVNGSKVIIAYVKYLAALYPLPQHDDRCGCKIIGQLESCKCYLKYINVEKEPANLGSQEWSERRLIPGLTADDRPTFKYYYLSWLAIQKMQDLQKVLSTSHLFPVGSSATALATQQPMDENEQIAIRTSLMVKNSRACLQSFSVANLRDECEQRAGMWITQPAKKTTKQSESPSFDFRSISTGQETAPESSRKIIPHSKIRSEPSLVPLQPTVFSFRLAQSLRKVRAKPFSKGKGQVLRRIRSVSPSSQRSVSPAMGSPNKSKLVSSKSAPGKLDANPEVQNDSSYIAHPNVKQGVNPQTIVSSTSQILYKKRLEKQISVSSTSVKSANPSFRLKSTDLAEQSASYLQTPSLIPGGPINTKVVLSSLPHHRFDKRTSREMVESIKAVQSLKMESILNASEPLPDAGQRLAASQTAGHLAGQSELSEAEPAGHGASTSPFQPDQSITGNQMAAEPNQNQQ